MAVFIRSKVWPGSIPYTGANDWAKQTIAKFNHAVGKQLFVARTNQADYVTFYFGEHSTSFTGRKGGQQKLSYRIAAVQTLFHEMGHTAGLGHEHYHKDWPGKLIVSHLCDIDRAVFTAGADKYESVLAWDPVSIMSYNPTAWHDAHGAELTLAYYKSVSNHDFREVEQLSQIDIATIRYLYPGVPDLHN